MCVCVSACVCLQTHPPLPSLVPSLISLSTTTQKKRSKRTKRWMKKRGRTDQRQTQGKRKLMDKECVRLGCPGFDRVYVAVVEIRIDKVKSQTINYYYSHFRQLLAQTLFPNKTCKGSLLRPIPLSLHLSSLHLYPIPSISSSFLPQSSSLSFTGEIQNAAKRGRQFRRATGHRAVDNVVTDVRIPGVDDRFRSLCQLVSSNTNVTRRGLWE